MDPAEVEFLSEKEIITIVPNFSQDKIYLIGGDIGPFNPSMPIDVPLWLALSLKQRQKCHVQPPTWMKVNTLEEKKTLEQEMEFFSEMPNSHYMELTQLLLKHAINDIPHADEIRVLIKDIWDLRQAKLRKGINDFVKSESTHAMLNNLTLMELNTVRPFLTSALDHMYQLRSNLTAAPSGKASQSQD